jgi:hypothetical protein
MGWVNSKLVVPLQSRKNDGSAHPQTRPPGEAAQLPYPIHAPRRTNGTRWQWQMFLLSEDREPVVPFTRRGRYNGVLQRKSLLRSADVMETESLCHGGGQVGRELTNLSLNIPEVGVTGPATHFLDNVVVLPSEFESHGTPRSQTMGTDTFEVVAVCFEVVEGGALSDGRAYFGGGDRTRSSLVVVKSAQ